MQYEYLSVLCIHKKKPISVLTLHLSSGSYKRDYYLSL